MKTFKQIREDAAKHRELAKDHYYGGHLLKKYGDDPDHHHASDAHSDAGKAHLAAAAAHAKHGGDSPQYKKAAKAAKSASKDAMDTDGHHDMKHMEPRYHDSMNDLKRSLRGK